MKLPVLAVLGAALLLSACAKKEAEACASPDVKDQLMRIFLQGAITERSPEFKDSALRDVAILEKLSLIHISEPTRQAEISYAVFCLKKKK